MLGGLPYAWGLAGEVLESLGISHTDHEVWALTTPDWACIVWIQHNSGLTRCC